VCVVEVQSLKICQRETHFVEVYFHIQMWLVPNNRGTEDENLTTDNVLQDSYFCFGMLDIGYYLRYRINLFVTVPLQFQKLVLFLCVGTYVDNFKLLF
jgi:hypothetical protein